MTYEAFDAARDEVERRHAGAIEAALNRHGDALAAAIEREDFPLAVFAEDGPIIAALEAVYRDAIPRFAETTLGELAPGEDKALSDWLDAVRRFIGSDGGSMIKRINATSLALVREVMAEGFAEGWGVRRIAREVRDRWGDLSRQRAETIARTEALRASNHGALAGAEQARERFGLTLEKVWLSTPDGRARDSHWALHETRVGMDAPFDVGGFPGLYPGDAALPPKESINCRCAVAFAPVGSEVRSWREERDERIREQYRALQPQKGADLAYCMIGEEHGLQPDTVRKIVHRIGSYA